MAKDVIIANHHTGPIVLPRLYNPNASADPAQFILRFDARTIQPGHSIPVPANEWEERKKLASMKYYLDHGHLQVVKREGAVDVNTDFTTNLEVPEHLQADQDGAVTVDSKVGDGSQVKAQLRRTSKGSVTI